MRTGTEIPDVQTAQGMPFVVEQGTTLEAPIDEPIRPTSRRCGSGPRRGAPRARVGGADVAPFDLPAAAAIAHADPASARRAAASAEPIAAALPKDSPNGEAVGSALRAMERTARSTDWRSAGSGVAPDLAGDIPC